MGVSVGCRGRAVLGTYIEMLARAAAAAAAARRYRVTSYPLTQLSLGLQVILDEADLVLQREQRVITRVISLTQHTAHTARTSSLESAVRSALYSMLTSVLPPPLERYVYLELLATADMSLGCGARLAYRSAAVILLTVLTGRILRATPSQCAPPRTPRTYHTPARETWSWGSCYRPAPPHPLTNLI